MAFFAVLRTATQEPKVEAKLDEDEATDADIVQMLEDAKAEKKKSEL